MKAVIVGCGRVGAALADELDRAGWQVLIIDLSSSAFDRLPSTFKGTAQRGDGTDEDTLRQLGGSDADLFLALTEGDNRNVMAAQLAVEALGARRVVAKINDPVRAEAYAHLGIASLCRTNLMTAAVLGYAGQAATVRPGIYAPERPHLHVDEAPASAVEQPVGVGGGGGGDASGAGSATVAGTGGPSGPGASPTSSNPDAGSEG
jgi:trk system potassium uptake protein TrkA